MFLSLNLTKYVIVECQLGCFGWVCGWLGEYVGSW